MSTDYYVPTDAAPANSVARSALIDSQFAAVAAGFALLPAKLPLQQNRVTHATDTGSANAYLVALEATPAAYVAGLKVSFVAANANTGASTINVSSLGAKSIKRYDGSALSSGDIVAGQVVELRYDGTNFQMVGALGGVAVAAAASASAASSSASAASASASAASSSASAASTSASAASTSASAAAASAVLASTYAGSALRAYLGTVTGTDTITSAYVITAYSTGQLIDFIAAGTNTGAVTININSLGAIAVVDQAGTALVAGMIVSGRRYTATYNGTHFRLGEPDASQAVAEAGTDNVGRMTALRTQQFFTSKLASTGEMQTGTEAAKAATPAGVKAATIFQGRHSIYLDASVFRPRETNGPEILSTSAEAATNKNRIDGLAFDQSTDELAQARFVLPKKYNLGTITAKPYWRAASGTGTVAFACRAVALSNDDLLDTAFGTEQTSTDTLIATTDLHAGPETAAITIAGTPAAEDMVWLEIFRDVSEDTLNADAILLGVMVYVTLNAATDT